MHIAKLMPAFLFVLLAACSDPPPSAVAVNDHDHQETVACKESIHPFWTKFRAAALAEDMEALAKMTELPLKVVRFVDGEKKFVSRQDFAKQFPQFLKAAPTDSWRDKDNRKIASMKDLMRMYHTLEKDACISEGYLRHDRWTFGLVPGGWFRPDAWRLVSIYVDEFSPSLKPIPLQH